MRAKLFNLPDELQSLVIKGNDKEPEPTIEYKFLGNADIELTMTASFPNKDARDKVFNKIEKLEMELMAENLFLFSQS